MIQDGRKAVSARHKEGAALSNAIPDDWDQETSSGEEDNQTIWDNACDIIPFSPPLTLIIASCAEFASFVLYRTQKQAGSHAPARRDVPEDGIHLAGRRATGFSLPISHSHSTAFNGTDSEEGRRER